MRVAVLCASVVLACFGVSGNGHESDESIVAYAKSIDVSVLDPAIPAGRLDTWLSGRTDRVEWVVSDCDLKAARDEPAKRRPVCVKIAFRRHEINGWVMIRVGNAAEGVAGPPVFEYAVATRPTELRDGKIKTILRMSELGEVLDRDK